MSISFINSKPQDPLVPAILLVGVLGLASILGLKKPKVEQDIKQVVQAKSTLKADSGSAAEISSAFQGSFIDTIGHFTTQINFRINHNDLDSARTRFEAFLVFLNTIEEQKLQYNVNNPQYRIDGTIREFNFYTTYKTKTLKLTIKQLIEIIVKRTQYKDMDSFPLIFETKKTIVFVN